MPEFIALLLLITAVALAYVPFAGWRLRRRALARLYDDEPARSVAASGQDRWLSQWLARAGYRRPQATALFVTATVVCAGVGVVAGQVYRAAMLASLVEMVSSMPGGVGEVHRKNGGVGLRCDVGLDQAQQHGHGRTPL